MKLAYNNSLPALLCSVLQLYVDGWLGMGTRNVDNKVMHKLIMYKTTQNV